MLLHFLELPACLCIACYSYCIFWLPAQTPAHAPVFPVQALLDLYVGSMQGMRRHMLVKTLVQYSRPDHCNVDGTQAVSTAGTDSAGESRQPSQPCRTWTHVPQYPAAPEGTPAPPGTPPTQEEGASQQAAPAGDAVAEQQGQGQGSVAGREEGALSDEQKEALGQSVGGGVGRRLMGGQQEEVQVEGVEWSRSGRRLFQVGVCGGHGGT